MNNSFRFSKLKDRTKNKRNKFKNGRQFTLEFEKNNKIKTKIIFFQIT